MASPVILEVGITVRDYENDVSASLPELDGAGLMINNMTQYEVYEE